MRGNPDPARICAELREIAASAPTRDRLAALRAALASKHESVVSIAAEGLAGWGRGEALLDLRAAFDRACARDRSFAQRRTLARAIARVVGPDDTEAVVGWFLSVPEYELRHDLYPALEGLDRATVLKLFRREWDRSGAIMKVSMFHAAQFLGSDGLLDGVLANDPDPFIRELAEHRWPPHVTAPSPWRSSLERLKRLEREASRRNAERG